MKNYFASKRFEKFNATHTTRDQIWLVNRYIEIDYQKINFQYISLGYIYSDLPQKGQHMYIGIYE